jgi:hypothetical protein
VGLYVSTTGTDVSIPELGFTLVHPATNYALSDQFSIEDIQMASTLTTVIRAGTLTWKKTSGGSAEAATDYDPDLLEADALNLGVGAQADRLVSFKDLTASTLKTKSGYKIPSDFSLNPKKATVTFGTAFPAGTTYSIEMSGTDVRFWTWESVTVSGFVINSNANQTLTGNVHFTATVHGETV